MLTCWRPQRLSDGCTPAACAACAALSLCLQLYQTVPQVLLPVLPHLKDELTVEAESKRLAAVELLCKLFTQPTIGAEAMSDYTHLFEELCKRFADTQAEVRLRLVTYVPALAARCREEAQLAALVRGVQQRLLDTEERVRAAAAKAACELLAARHSGPAASLVDAVTNRLRDKKAGVRREVASHLGKLMAAWVVQCESGAAGAPPHKKPLALALCLANLAVRDSDLGPHVLETTFRQGIFPPKLPAEAAVRWWAQLWQQAGPTGHEALAHILRRQCAMQAQLQDLLRLRTAVKEQRASSLVAASSAATAGASAGPSGSRQGPAGAAPAVADPKQAMQQRLHQVAVTLHEVGKAEEGEPLDWYCAAFGCAGLVTVLVCCMQVETCCSYVVVSLPSTCWAEPGLPC